MTATTESDRVRVALVDDHSMVREALALILESDERFEIVGQGGDRHDAVRITTELQPDVLVLDYAMPGGGALLAIEDITREGIRTRILVLTVHKSIHYAVRVLEVGAHGFLVKSSAVEELVEAIRVVQEGDIYITPQLSSRVLNHLLLPKRERVGIDALSIREFEILRILGSGTGLKEAASELSISTSTASTYRVRLMKKLGLTTTAELIRYALEQGVAR